jgi:hypothetical protein
MAAPNIVAVTSINGKSALSRPANTNTFSILTNTASSGRVYKINTIVCSNHNGTLTTAANVYINDSANGAGNNIALIYNVSIPATVSLIVVDKSTSFYLEENKSITVSSATSNAISFTVSYEDIS